MNFIILKNDLSEHNDVYWLNFNEFRAFDPHRIFIKDIDVLKIYQQIIKILVRKFLVQQTKGYVKRNPNITEKSG